jgi:hypothetical protein
VAELFLQISTSLDGGTPLFDADGKRRNLRLTASQPFDSGATMHRYRVA